MVYPPAVILIVLLIAINPIGEAARDSLDIRLQCRRSGRAG
jgi:ABC-type dipeptide/oligopeptide/nickel transport system permease subunit